MEKDALALIEIEAKTEFKKKKSVSLIICLLLTGYKEKAFRRFS